LERFDPSLAATHAELGLARVNWENCARAGCWGRGVRGGGILGVVRGRDGPMTRSAYAVCHDAERLARS